MIGTPTTRNEYIKAEVLLRSWRKRFVLLGILKVNACLRFKEEGISNESPKRHRY